MPIKSRLSLYQPRSCFDAAGGAGSTLKTGLISFWEIENTSWTDSVIATGNNLTGNGSPTVVSGLVGNAVSLTAATPKWLGHASNSSLQVGGTDFSVSAWVNATSLADGAIILSKVNGFGNSEYELQDTFSSGHKFQFRIFQGGGGGVDSLLATTAPSTSAWLFIVATYTTATKGMTISVNAGTRDTTTGTQVVASGTAPFNIGNGNDDATPNNFGWNGLIDQVGFWKKVLTTSEEAQLYNSGAGLSYAAM